MPPLSPTRHLGLNYHVEEGAAWLAASDAGSRSTMLAYAAFELRLALERLMLEYLVRIEGNQLTADSLKLLSSIKRVENRIYELEGHQREIDRKFEVFEILFDMLQVPFMLAKPQFGDLSRYGHECSDLCHVTWTLYGASNDQKILADAFRRLSEIHAYLKTHTGQLVTWPAFAEPAAQQLERRHIAGDASADDVRAHFRKRGVWAATTRPDGTSEFVVKE